MSPGTEFARDFCAGIGTLQRGVVLVSSVSWQAIRLLRRVHFGRVYESRERALGPFRAEKTKECWYNAILKIVRIKQTRRIWFHILVLFCLILNIRIYRWCLIIKHVILLFRKTFKTPEVTWFQAMEYWYFEEGRLMWQVIQQLYSFAGISNTAYFPALLLWNLMLSWSTENRQG